MTLVHWDLGYILLDHQGWFAFRRGGRGEERGGWGRVGRRRRREGGGWGGQGVGCNHSLPSERKTQREGGEWGGGGGGGGGRSEEDGGG